MLWKAVQKEFKTNYKSILNCAFEAYKDKIIIKSD